MNFNSAGCCAMQTYGSPKRIPGASYSARAVERDPVRPPRGSNQIENSGRVLEFWSEGKSGTYYLFPSFRKVVPHVDAALGVRWKKRCLVSSVLSPRRAWRRPRRVTTGRCLQTTNLTGAVNARSQYRSTVESVWHYIMWDSAAFGSKPLV